MTLESAQVVGGGAILGGGTAPTNSFTLDLFGREVINSNHRLHPIVKAQKTKNIREITRFTSNAKGVVKMERAHCFAWISFPDKRRRDYANLYPTIKAGLDGFIDSGILPDDSDEFLIGPDMRTDEPNANKVYRFRFDFYEVA